MKNNALKFLNDTDDFYSTLKRKVALYFESNGLTRYGGSKIYRKAIILVSLYLLTYISLFIFTNIWFLMMSYIMMGILMIVIGINLGHDAVHNAVSSNKKINNLFKYSFELLGASSYAWEKRHVQGHHIYPNIRDKDPDTTQSKIVRIYSNNKWARYHQFQFIYIPFLYLFYSLNWTLIRDYTDIFSSRASEYLSAKKTKGTIFKFIVSKLIYLSAFFLLLPIFSNLSIIQAIIGFFIMHVSASICLTIALVPSHLSEDSTFPEADESGSIKSSWAHHQVIVTNDFATDNKFITYAFGAFNHHIVHHLFPKVCHVHYEALTPIIKETILEYGLPYNYQESIAKSYISHFIFLMRLGKKPTENFEKNIR